MVSLVRSSSVGPKPPVVMTTSLRPSASSNAPRSLPGLSPTVQAKSRLTPMAESSRATNAASVLIVCPSKSSVPTEMISAFIANPVAEMWKTALWEKPLWENAPPAGAARAPHPPKTFPSWLQQKPPRGIRKQDAGHPRRPKRLRAGRRRTSPPFSITQPMKKTGKDVVGHPSPSFTLAIRASPSLSCGHEPLWEGRGSTAPR